jgi:leucine dehydrogenase
VADMANVFATTRFTTCIPPSLGGSGNPSVPTARGVVCGMEAALELLGERGLAGKSVAIQGIGNVGGSLARFLLEKGAARIVAADVNPRHVERARAELPPAKLEARLVEEGDDSIFRAECDVFSPNATGAILNDRTIPLIRARIVCGAANNQLEDSARDDGLLHARGILYVPDFLVNRMGIVNCADEHAGQLPDDPLVERHLSRDWEYSIHRMCHKVVQRSRDTGQPPSQVAEAIADELSLVPHTIFGHRGQAIIDSLAADRWHEGGEEGNP